MPILVDVRGVYEYFRKARARDWRVERDWI
jgi:hypothetical protein